jgi:hypothetical protein
MNSLVQPSSPNLLRVPRSILAQLPNLHGADLKVLLAVTAHHDRVDIAQIAATTGLSRRSCFSSLKALQEFNLVPRRNSSGDEDLPVALGDPPCTQAPVPIGAKAEPQDPPDSARRAKDLLTRLTRTPDPAGLLEALMEFTGADLDRTVQCLSALYEQGDRFHPGDQFLQCAAADWLRGLRRRPIHIRR